MICNGAEAYMNEVVQSEYGSDTVTNIFCFQSERRTLFVDTEKPVLAFVTTTFARGASAPRRFRYDEYLNKVMIGKETSTELPGFIIAAATASGESFDRGVFTRLDTSIDPPVLVVEFGTDTSPTAAPASSQFRVSSTSEGANSPTPSIEDSESSGAVEIGYLSFSFTLLLGLLATL